MISECFTQDLIARERKESFHLRARKATLKSGPSSQKSLNKSDVVIWMGNACLSESNKYAVRWCVHSEYFQRVFIVSFISLPSPFWKWGDLWSRILNEEFVNTGPGSCGSHPVLSDVCLECIALNNFQTLVLFVSAHVANFRICLFERKKNTFSIYLCLTKSVLWFLLADPHRRFKAVTPFFFYFLFILFYFAKRRGQTKQVKHL